MARYWQPKYPVCCMHCGWTGKRTRATKHKKCPRCRHARVVWAKPEKDGD